MPCVLRSGGENFDVDKFLSQTDLKPTLFMLAGSLGIEICLSQYPREGSHPSTEMKKYNEVTGE